MASKARPKKTHEGTLREHAAQLLAEAGRDWRSISWHEKTSRGSIQKCGGHITAPYPTSRRRLMTLCHEIGHHVLHWAPAPDGNGWNMNARAAAMPRHLLEYEAEEYVRLWFWRQGIELHEKEMHIGQRYVASCVVTDLLAGVPIDADVVKWIDLAQEDYLEVWATMLDGLSMGVPQPLLDFIGVPDALTTAPEFAPGGALHEVWLSQRPFRKWHAVRSLLRFRAAKPETTVQLAGWERMVVRLANWLKSRLPRWLARWDLVRLS